MIVIFKVIEKFVSIDGEGPTSGQLAVFIRFQGCNLRCSWCDTKYSYDEENISEVLSAEEIYKYIKDSNCINVTLTGGEPLIQKNIHQLLKMLNDDESLKVHIETNGSISIKDFKSDFKNLSFIVDFKLPLSNMTSKMDYENLKTVDFNDVYKFVIGTREDLNKAYEIIKEYDLTERCIVYFSPVTGSIDMQDMVEFMKEKNLNKVRLQVQLHKIIWDKEARGV